jgi:hypothetical protein
MLGRMRSPSHWNHPNVLKLVPVRASAEASGVGP